MAYVLLALFDPIKGPVYLIHTFSYLAAGFGATVWWLTQEPGPRKLYVAAAAALALVQLIQWNQSLAFAALDGHGAVSLIR